jgi:tRNA-dihydrouridine synthase 3
MADWEYIKSVARAQSPDLPRLPIIGTCYLSTQRRLVPCVHVLAPLSTFVALRRATTTRLRTRLKQVVRVGAWVTIGVVCAGNGDILSWTDYQAQREAFDEGLLAPCAMLGRGALIKPWLPTEIKEERHWDISASER